jgi:hypothetical protein
LLLDKGLSHRNITLLLVTINVLAIIASYTFRNSGCTWIVLALIIFFFSGIAALYYTRHRPRLFVARSVNGVDGEPTNSKIVPLTKDTILEQKN